MKSGWFAIYTGKVYNEAALPVCPGLPCGSSAMPTFTTAFTNDKKHWCFKRCQHSRLPSQTIKNISFCCVPFSIFGKVEPAKYLRRPASIPLLKPAMHASWFLYSPLQWKVCDCNPHARVSADSKLNLVNKQYQCPPLTHSETNLLVVPSCYG